MALRRIALRDFVIVQALDLDLQTGFTVLTGETGAGKSILIDALQLLLGARADSGVIRNVMPLRESLSTGSFSSLSFSFDADVQRHEVVHTRQGLGFIRVLDLDRRGRS